MVRKEISLFLKNVPGELGKLAALLAEAGINIDSVSVQDASAYVSDLMNARGKSLKRIASTRSYDSMRKDSDEFALVRLLLDRTDEGIELLAREGYIFDVVPVIAMELRNEPGRLAGIATRLGQAGINIKYVHGAALAGDERGLFVFCPDDMERAAQWFED